jgi:D-alanine-D-alanine ligase
MDKIAQKQILQREGFPIPHYVAFRSSEVRQAPRRVIAGIERHLRYPLFVKPANTGSSVGISKAHNRKELRGAIELACQYDRRVLVEQGIAGAREIECAVLGNDAPIASVLGEIIPSNEFYDYEAKYVDGKSQALIPAPLPGALASKIRAMALRAFRAIDCAGMARVDFFVTRRSRRVYLNELNTIPGFTTISMYPKLWEASGISYPALLDRLIALALERHQVMSGLRRTYTPAKEWYR